MNDEELVKNAEAQRAFFNAKAPVWRAEAKSEAAICELLSPIPLKRGDSVLDVACGAGVLDGCLLSMGLKVDAVDISDKMIEKALANPVNRGANYFVADFYGFNRAEKYDFLLVFDAYPHFPDKLLFREKAYSLLKDDGMLWIFFDLGKDKVNGNHSGQGGAISVGLAGAEEEAEVFKDRFDAVFMQDAADSYYIGLKKKINK